MSSWPETRCEACPRVKDGPCFAQAHRTRHLCDGYAAGDRDFEAILTGEKALTPVGAGAAVPPLLARAANFAGAAVAHVAAGLPRAGDAVYEARLAACRACPRFIPADCQCGACGCGLAVKARWADQRCPLGKWPG